MKLLEKKIQITIDSMKLTGKEISTNRADKEKIVGKKLQGDFNFDGISDIISSGLKNKIQNMDEDSIFSYAE